MEEIRIPRLLDEKERILFLHLYELCLFIGGLFAGIFLKVPFFGLVLGISLFGMCRYMKRKGMIDKIGNYCYWHFPEWMMGVLQYKLEGTPPNYLGRFSG